MKSIVKKITSAAISAAMVLSSVPALGAGVFASADSSLEIGPGGVPKGFVYTSGNKFKLNGSDYYYGGTNCYYLIYKEQDAVRNVLDDCVDMGLKVIRTWGNLDVGTKADNFSESNPVFNNSRDGVGQKDGVYFQYFDKSQGKPVVNEGANGLRRLDYVISEAEKRGLKLIITFTNYWEAFGGMDQYCMWMKEAGLGDFKRNAFYTNETMKKWYKNYVNTLLNHENYYTGKKLKDSEGVFAWELCNEPRVDSSFGDSNNENETDIGCKKNILYNWAKEMSEYVKSIDPYHMVSVGDEGFYNYGKTNDEINEIGVDSYFAFTGDAGVDFDKLMSIDTIDFGTPHMYCDQWNMAWKPDSQGIGSQINNGKDDDVDWIKMHAESGKKANKPVILEEFGLSHKNCNIISQSDKSGRDPYYKKWLDLLDGTAEDGKYQFQGFTFWMIGSRGSDSQGFPNGYYPDWDGYTIYGNAEDDAKENPNSNARQLIIDSAEKMNKLCKKNGFSNDPYKFNPSNGSDIKAEVTMYTGSLTGKLFVNGDALTKGTDYTYDSSGKSFTIKKSFLSKLKADSYTLTAEVTEGETPEATISVGIENGASINPAEISIDKNTKKCSDVSVNITKQSDDSLRAVKYKGKTLTKGSDYTVNSNTVVLSKSFLTTVDEGKSEVEFVFNYACPVKLSVTADDTTGLDELDTFESYNSSDDVWGAYSRNTNGDELSLDIAQMNGSKVLKYSYNVGGNGYCGITKSVGETKLSGYKGISLWVKGDGSGNKLTIQFKSGDVYKEAYITLNFTGEKKFFFTFDELKNPSWNSGDLDVSKISEYSIYVDKASDTTSGTIYIDNVVAADGLPSELKDISECDISLSRTTATYTSKAIKPIVTIMDGSKKLVKDVDYTVSYFDNVRANGTPTITITGKGNYTGTVKKYFTITKKSIGGCDITLNKRTFTFNKTAIKPEVTVSLNGNVLDPKNYSLSYKDNIAAGTATVTITGKNSLQGTTTRTYKIVARSLSQCTVKLSGTSFKYTGSAIKPTVKVIVAGEEINKSNYTVSYKNNTAKGTAKVVITGRNSLKDSVTKTFTIK